MDACAIDRCLQRVAVDDRIQKNLGCPGRYTRTARRAEGHHGAPLQATVGVIDESILLPGPTAFASPWTRPN